METKQKSAKIAVSLLVLAGLLVFSLFAVGGSLEPSAPPGPTMKTLDEVEPRIPIPASAAPTGTFTISSPGSYYLTGDRHASGIGILVEANDVTIDLMGYQLVGPDSGTNYGIYMNGRSNVEIRNGTVRDFYYGIYEVSSSGKNHRVIDVRSVSNGQHGIYLYGKSNLVKGCTVSDNGTSATGSYVYGINAGAGSTVTGNTANDNGTSATGNSVFGIRANYGSTVTGNIVYDNGNSATSSVYGIVASRGCTVTGNTAYGNGNSATGTVYGIYASDGCTVTGNTAYYNGLSAKGSYVYGILAGDGCTVTGNTAYYNGYLATGTVYGIYAYTYCLVDQNTAYSNSTNMYTGTGCVLGLNVAP